MFYAKHVNRYIKLNKYVNILAKTLRRFKITSDTDDIMDQLLGETTGEIADEVAEEAVPIEQQYKRERFGSASCWRSFGGVSR